MMLRREARPVNKRPVPFRLQFLLIVLLSVSLPMMATQYVLMKRAEDALLEEKQQKLLGLARQLDLMLPGSFDDLLAPAERTAPRLERIRAINRKLALAVDRIAALYPGVGIGYYSRDLDAVVAYAPSSQLQKNVGQPIAPDHPGRAVMARGEEDVHIGQQMRGDIMNAMHPLVRSGRVVGYTWANELTTDVDMQIGKMERNMYLILAAGLALACIASYRLFSHVASFIDRIIKDIDQVGRDLSYRLSVPRGVLGRIPAAVNRMLEQLRESRTLKEHIVANVRDGIVTQDMHGLITEWNPAMEAITGIAAQEAIGQPLGELIAGCAQAEAGAAMCTGGTGSSGKDGEDGPRHPVQTSLVRADGTRVPVEWNAAVLKNGEEAIGTLVVVRDLTEKERAEEQLRRADRLRAVGELAAGMAHEIRNPLTSIKAFAQIIEESVPPEDEERTYTAIIVQEVERINRIVERLLLFAKPAPFRQVAVRFGSVVQETVTLVEGECRRKGVQMDLGSGGDATVNVDPELLKQVVLNLLLNAIQAAPDGGSIRVSFSRTEREVTLSVWNEGEPIPEAYRDRIFDPFFSTKEKGTGLGLSVSQSIVRLYRGRLAFENRDGGVAFTVTLARADGRGDEGSS